jgi:2-dehydro-3-deoxygluconokinase
MARFVTFGEALLRLSPPGMLRLQQAIPGQLEVTLAGAEANVAGSLAMLGAETRYVTALPEGTLGDTLTAALRARNINTNHIIRSGEGRLGLVFVENGANQRPSRVVYDREGTTISLTTANHYDWQAIFSGVDRLHITGITPSLSQCAAEATLEAVRQAKAGGISISCDLNFRSKLWRWDAERSARQLANEIMSTILPHVDLLIANETDCGDVLDIHTGTDVGGDRPSAEAYPDLARRVASRFPNIQMIAITLRESLSASHNNWSGMLYDVQTDQAYFAPQQQGVCRSYEIRHLVDRVGAGDAFAAGLLFALTEEKYSRREDAIAFAVAASCLAHSVVGDMNFSSLEEIEMLLSGSGSGRVVR